MQYEMMSVSERRTLPPAVAVSTVAFALHPPAAARLGAGERAAGSSTLWLPLVRRTRLPFQGLWALPGGPTEWDETLSGTALRTLHDVVGTDPGYLEQLYSFGGVERSADAQRLVTIAYWALYGEHDFDIAEAEAEADAEAEAEAANDDGNVAWFPADQLPQLAFDHAEIIAYALARLRSKTEYASVAHRFLGDSFTLGRLRAVTEAVTGRAIDPANFRRQTLARGEVIETGDLETGAAHRPAKLYRFRDDASAPRDTPDPEHIRSRP